MAQAATLNDAQIKRALRYCQSRKYVMRDSTILLFSIYTGLRAKELAALRIGDVYDADGEPRTQFTLSAEQTKGSRTRTVFVNKQLRAQLVSTHSGDALQTLLSPCSAVKRVDTFQQTPCVSCSSTYTRLVGSVTQVHTAADAHS